MSLIDELKKIELECHKEWFDRFFDDLKIEQQIKEVAMEGFRGYKIPISDLNDRYLERRLNDKKTVDLLKSRLGDGFKVEIVILESDLIFFGKRWELGRHLKISWATQADDLIYPLKDK